MRALPVLLAAALLAVPAHAVSRRVAPTIPGRQAYTCAANSFALYDDTNNQDTQGGGTPGTFDTKGRTYCVDSIATSHENAAPGTVGLEVISGLGAKGQALGPWAASGDNETWTAEPTGPPLIHGRYTC